VDVHVRLMPVDVYFRPMDSDGCRIFFWGKLTLYIHIFQGAKMSLISYSIAFSCMDHLLFGGAIGGATSAFGEGG